MDKKTKKIGSLVACALIIGATGFAAGNYLHPDVDVDSLKSQSFQEGFEKGVDSVDITVDNEEAFLAGASSVEPEVIVDEKVVEVEVENTESYDRLEQLLKDREIFDDAYSVLEQLEAEDEAIKLAIAEIKDELAEELEDADMVDDEDDVDDIDIEEDYDDIKILKSDFEDEEYKFEFKVEFEDEDKDEKFDVLVTVEVEEGVAKIKDVQWD